MSEELQQQLAEYLGSILETMKAGGEFMSSQAPLLVQDVLTFAVMSGTAWLLLTSTAAYVTLMPLRCFLWGKHKTFKAAKPEMESIAFGGTLVVSGVGILMCVLSVINAAEIAKALFAQRLYIVDWLISRM